MARPMQFALMLEAPWRDPTEVLSTFAEEPWAIGFLSGGGGPRGRWSYLARQPVATLVVHPSAADNPFDSLRGLLGPALLRLEDAPPFQGGLAGLATYELGDHVEALGLERLGDWPDLAAGLYGAVLAFDHLERRVLAVGRGHDAHEARARAEQALGWCPAADCTTSHLALTTGMTASSRQAYEVAVADVVAKIEAGDIFQANIARAWTGRLRPGAKPFDILERLLVQSSAPFAAYLRLEDRAVVSNSPERFLKLDAEGWVETRPIKGTRPRGDCPAQDAALARELCTSIKDCAENLMIVDLMRNDLARVCRPGSVAVPELFALESFANVHHLVSTVVGRLRQGLGAADLLRAAFPPGSITGAPKVQAMKTIAQLETPRGPYCGAMFWAGLDGAMDSSVLIRTVACVEDADGWQVEARAGAGIVADSQPVAERLETEAKISALVLALTGGTP